MSPEQLSSVRYSPRNLPQVNIGSVTAKRLQSLHGVVVYRFIFRSNPTTLGVEDTLLWFCGSCDNLLMIDDFLFTGKRYSSQSGIIKKIRDRLIQGKNNTTRLITMRSKPDYVEFVLLQLLLMLKLWFLLLQLFIRGQLWSIKVYLILIEAITVVEVASRLALTLLLPCFYLALSSP